MVQRKRKTIDPCLTCYLHKSRCICEHIQPLELKTKIFLIVHHKELKKSTNTGRLALEALTNSEMKVRGVLGEERLNLSSILDKSAYQTFLFYPAEDALELDEAFIQHYEKHFNQPIQLIVPDGNWRQASKVHYRHPELAELPRLKISTPNLATRHMRKESTPNGMATMEAIACALGFIEGAQVQEHLMKIYLKKLEQTLKGRGTY